MLTEKQKTVLRALTEFRESKGKMPTLRELQEYLKQYDLDLKSVRSVAQHLDSLDSKGLIDRSSEPRGISIKGISDGLRQVPIHGVANAGAPTFFADQNLDGYLNVSKRIAKKDEVFAIKVEGTSMDRADIPSGSYVLVDPTVKNYQNEDKVLAIIDGLATVKKYKKIKNNKVGLFPDSSDEEHKPIYLHPEDEALINGKVIDVLQDH